MGINNYFENIYNNCVFIIYYNFNQNNNELIGKYDLPLFLYEKIISWAKKKLLFKTYEQTIYQYNNKEITCQKNNDGDDNATENYKFSYIHKEYLFQNIESKMLINILNIKNIDPYSLPILNKYDFEATQDITEFRLQYINLYLVKEINKYYCYCRFLYKPEKTEIINNDLNIIESIFSTLSKNI